MKIRINCEDYSKAISSIRNRAAKGEWSTWDTVDVKNKNGTFKRLIHVPDNDDQYKVVQIKLCGPSEEDKKKGLKYIDLIPGIKNTTMTIKQKKEKKGVVLGRFCEILNRYFPTLTEYKVILKEKK